MTAFDEAFGELRDRLQSDSADVVVAARSDDTAAPQLVLDTDRSAECVMHGHTSDGSPPTSSST